MNNVKRNWKTKSALRRMADGGVVRPNDDQFNGPMRAVDAMAEGRDPNEDRRRKAAEYGMSPKPAQKEPPGLLDKAKAKFSELRKAVGMADGGKVRGPGGPTEDKIDAKLSDGEYVLPADTVAAIGVPVLDALRDATHKKGTSKLRDGVLHAAGGYSPNRQMRDGIRPTMDMAKEQIARDLDAEKIRADRALRRAQNVTVGNATQTEFDAARARQAGVGLRGDQFAEEGMRREQARSRAASRAGYASPQPAATAGPAGPAGPAASQPKWYQPKSFGAKALTKTVGAVGKVAAPVWLGAAAADLAQTDTPEIAERFPQYPNRGTLGDDLRLRTVGAVDSLAGGMLGGRESATPTAVPGQQLRAPAPAGSGTEMFRTGDGRQAPLPAGIKVAYTADGRPAFGGSVDSIRAAGGQVDTNPVASPLRAPDLNNMGSNFGMVNSNAGGIRNDYGALRKQLIDMYGGKAQGTLASKLLALEGQKAEALGRDQGNLIDSQGNLVSDVGNKRTNAVGIYGDQVSAQNAELSARAASLDAQAKIGERAAAAQEKRQTENYERLLNAARARHRTADGKPDEAAAIADVESTMRNYTAGPDGVGLLDLKPQEASAASAQITSDNAIKAIANADTRYASDAPVTFDTPRADKAFRKPTLREAFDPQSPVTLADNVNDLVDFVPEWLGGPGTSALRVDDQGRAVRQRKLTKDQKQRHSGGG